MIRELAMVLSEAVDTGFERGLNEMFMENLEIELHKRMLIENEGGINNAVRALFESEGYEVSDDEDEFDEVEYSDEEYDALEEEIENME